MCIPFNFPEQTKEDRRSEAVKVAIDIQEKFGVNADIYVQSIIDGDEYSYTVEQFSETHIVGWIGELKIKHWVTLKFDSRNQGKIFR